MIASIKKILHPTTEPVVAVEIVRNCSVGGVPYQVGDRPAVSQRIAAELVAAGAALDPAAQDAAAARQRKLSELLPPAQEAKPLPESWEQLPSCFSQWWDLNEQGRLLIARAATIEKILIDKLSAGLWKPTPGGMPSIPGRDLEAVVEKLAVGKVRFSPEEEAEQRYLRDAHARAEKAAADWKSQHGPSVTKYRFLCSQAALEVHATLELVAREVQFTGRSIFAARVAALGLGEGKIDELFRGSADFEKFVSPAIIPMVPSRRMAWFEDSGRDQASYIDRGVPTLAHLWEKYIADREALQKLLKTAQAELTRTKKAAA